jgi:hypothetical protein
VQQSFLTVCQLLEMKNCILDVKVKVSAFRIATLYGEISDQYRFTSWQATCKNDAWSSAHCGLTVYDGLAPSHPTLQLV